jgi:hypothetical protein
MCSLGQDAPPLWADKSEGAPSARCAWLPPVCGGDLLELLPEAGVRAPSPPAGLTAPGLSEDGGDARS